MEKTLTIEKNEAIQTKTGKTYHQITAQGITYSVWDFETAQQLTPGTTWVVDVEQKGQFRNITGIVTQLTNVHEIPSPGEQKPIVHDPEWGYNRRAALEKATMLAVANIGMGVNIPSRTVIETADSYFHWLSPNDEPDEMFGKV